MMDYHVHTRLCGHAEGEMEEYVARAVRLSLNGIGFADHLPMVRQAFPGLAMRMKDLDQYVDKVLLLREMFPAIRILLGIEADYFGPDSEDEIDELLTSYPFDYVYGSVHFIGDWPFDHPDYVDEWERRDVNDVYRQYFGLLRQAAVSGLFDIMAHSDLVKKFGHRPTEDLSDDMEETVRVFRETGVAVEINTSGWRRPAAEAYPSSQIIELLSRYQVPIVFGSDAHEPEQVGSRFDEAASLARDCGHDKAAVFENRRITGSRKLAR